MSFASQWIQKLHTIDSPFQSLGVTVVRMVLIQRGKFEQTFWWNATTFTTNGVVDNSAFRKSMHHACMRGFVCHIEDGNIPVHHGCTVNPPHRWPALKILKTTRPQSVWISAFWFFSKVTKYVLLPKNSLEIKCWNYIPWLILHQNELL